MHELHYFADPVNQFYDNKKNPGTQNEQYDY